MKLFMVFLIMPMMLLHSKICYSFEVGVGTHLSGFNGTPQGYINLLKKYNITSFRTDYHWSDVEKIKGVYSPANNKLDELIELAVVNNITPVLILDYGNPLYTAGKPISKMQQEAFSKYAAWTVNHFKNKVRVYEIWNEWHLEKPRYLSQSLSSAKEYVELVRASYTEIKRVDSNAIVIAGSFNPTQPDEVIWQDKIFKLGILDYIDGVSLHTYHNTDHTFMPPCENLTLIDDMQKKIVAIKGRKIPVYITEIGISDYYKNTISESDIAQFARDYFLQARKRDYIQGVWWYDFINDGDDRKNGEHNFGILNKDLSEKSTAPIVKNILREAEHNNDNK